MFLVSIVELVANVPGRESSETVREIQRSEHPRRACSDAIMSVWREKKRALADRGTDVSDKATVVRKAGCCVAWEKRTGSLGNQICQSGVCSLARVHFWEDMTLAEESEPG
jgi:hypothetical protein